LLRSHLLHRPAGILVTGFDRTDATRRLIAGSGVPCVHLMETADDPDVYSVGLSQRAAGRAMTQHLLERGRRRIAFAAAQLDPRTLQRLEGWRDAMRTAGLHAATLEWLNPAPSSIELGGLLFAQIMGQHPPVDAIFFCNDDLAQGALLGALRAGVAVPQRVAIAGFNDLTGSDQMLPPLTTVRTPRAEIGTEAASMLLHLMRGEAVPRRCVDLGFEIVPRGST